jgi:putative membrane protein
MKKISEFLRGMVIGLANIIPGVSGGTMMVSMGVYDTIICCVNNLFKDFKRSVLTLLPYGLGMLAAIVALASLIKYCLATFPLQTNCLFIGLILGGLPAILARIKGKKKGIPGAAAFAAAFALIILLELFGHGEGAQADLTLGVLTVVKLFVVGMIASATMIIPGVSGSMMLMLLGYYNPILTTIENTVKALAALDFSALLSSTGVLLPFVLGIAAGIFGVAKLIEYLLRRWEGVTFCGILGLVAASPVVILMGVSWAGVGVGAALAGIVLFAAGFYAALRLGE